MTTTGERCPKCDMVVVWPDGGRGLHTDDCPHASGTDDDMEARARDYAEQEITRWPPSDAEIEAHLVAFARAEVERAVREERERLVALFECDRAYPDPPVTKGSPADIWYSYIIAKINPKP